MDEAIQILTERIDIYENMIVEIPKIINIVQARKRIANLKEAINELKKLK